MITNLKACQMLVDNVNVANGAHYISKQNQGTFTPSTIKHHLYHACYQP